MTDHLNNSDETLAFSGALAKGASKVFAESLSLHGFQPASAYSYAADLGIYDVALNADEVAEFIRTRSPIGYSPFRDFVASEYKFEKAYVQFQFRPLDGADAQLSLDQAHIFADVPDRAENALAEITNASTGLAVTFSRAFAATPKVTVTPVSTTPVIAVLTVAPTTTGFTVKLFDLTGGAVTGSFFWTALGY
jgi:hypothetical protein